MSKATVKVLVSEYVKYWEKAVKQSMKQMEYACFCDKIDKPWWKVWEQSYVDSPMTDTDEYWSVMQGFYPWTEIKGIDFLSKSKVNSSAQVVMSVELYTLTRKLAEQYDRENENE